MTNTTNTDRPGEGGRDVRVGGHGATLRARGDLAAASSIINNNIISSIIVDIIICMISSTIIISAMIMITSIAISIDKLL